MTTSQYPAPVPTYVRKRWWQRKNAAPPPQMPAYEGPCDRVYFVLSPKFGHAWRLPTVNEAAAKRVADLYGDLVVGVDVIWSYQGHRAEDE